MPLNHCTRAAPYAPRNYPRTNLNTGQSSSIGEIHSSQHSNLQISNAPNSFTMGRPFLFPEQVWGEEPDAIPAPFAETSEHSALQPSIQINNCFPPSYFFETSKAFSHLFPNQFTWNPLTTIGPNLIQQDICHANLPLAEEEGDTSPGQSLNTIDPALQLLLNPINGNGTMHGEKVGSDEEAIQRLFSHTHEEKIKVKGKGSSIQNFSSQNESAAITKAKKTSTKKTSRKKQKNDNAVFQEISHPSSQFSGPNSGAVNTTAGAPIIPKHITEQEIKTKNEDNLIQTLFFNNKINLKRAEQNRLAQKTFRTKQKAYMTDLKIKSVRLGELKNKIEHLIEQVNQLEPQQKLKFLEILKKSDLIKE